MLATANLKFYAVFLNSLIVRRPVLVSAGKKGDAGRLKTLVSFIPDHRWLLVTGKVPKWAKYLPNQPRDLSSADLPDLRSALISTFEEERMGRRAVQLIHFGLNAQVYEHVLKHLPKGWTAIADDVETLVDVLPKEAARFEVDSGDGFYAVHLGPEPENIDFETNLLTRAVNRNESFAVFLVQKKLSDMHLASNAVLRELEESTQAMTLVDLEEIFELDHATIERQFELIESERNLDLRKYMPAPPPEVLQTVDALCRIPHTVAVASVKDASVIHLRRLRSTELKLSALSVNLCGFLKHVTDRRMLGDCRHLLLSARDGKTVVLTRNGDVAHCVFFGPEVKPASAVSNVRECLKTVESV